MSTSNTKSKAGRATPTESIVKKFKPNQKKRTVKENHVNVSNKIIKTHMPSKKVDEKTKQQVGEKETETADLVDIKEIPGLEYYPLKRKRDIILRKVQMKSRHELTVIAQTNKRKRSIPQKDSSSLSENEGILELDTKISLKKALERRVPMESMYELIEETEKNGGLDDEDLQEILTCESPVWWEDAPDGYTEDPLFTRPRSASDMYPSVRTQLKRDFRELKRANSPIVLSKHKWNKENVLKTIVKPRKRQSKDIDLTDGEMNGSNEETENNEPSDIDLRLPLNNCDDTFKAKRIKLESTVKKISITSNIVVSVKPKNLGDGSICSKVSVIKNVNSMGDQKEISEADPKHTDNEGIDDMAFLDGDCLNDLKNHSSRLNVSVQGDNEGITMKQLISTIDEVFCENDRESQIIDDQKVHDDALIDGRQIIKCSTDLQSNIYSKDSDAAKTCESETNVCEEIRTNDNHNAINANSEVSENTEKTQSSRTFEITQINKCLKEIEIARNFEKAQSDNSFEGTQCDNSVEISSECLFEDRQYENISEEESENYFEDMVSGSYDESQVATNFKQRESKNYYKDMENENTEQEEPENYYEVVQSYNVEEVQSRNFTESMQCENFRQAQDSSGNNYDESQVTTDLDHVKSGLSGDVESGIFFHNREQSEIYSGLDEDLQSQNCIECMQSSNYKELDENVEHVESGHYYENAQTENIDQVQSGNYFEGTHSNKYEEAEVAINYEQSENIFESTQPNSYEEAEIDKNLERVESKNCYEDFQSENIENVQSDNSFESMQSCNYERTQVATNIKLTKPENSYEKTQSENIEQMTSENYFGVMQSGKYEQSQIDRLKQAKPDNHYDNLQSENIDQLQSENYFENMQTQIPNRVPNLQQTEADNYYEHVQSENIENMQSENYYVDIPSSNYEEIQVDLNLRQSDSENYYEDMQPGNYEETQVVTNIKLAKSEYYYRDVETEKRKNEGSENYFKSMQSGHYEETLLNPNFKQTESDNYYEENNMQYENNGNVESENYIQAICCGDYEGTQVVTNKLAEPEMFYKDRRSENFEQSEKISEGMQSDDNCTEKQVDRSHAQNKTGNYFETLHSAKYDETQATMFEKADPENYYDDKQLESIAEVPSEHYSEGIRTGKSYERKKVDSNDMPEECENYLEVMQSANEETNVAINNEPIDSEKYFEILQTENLEQVQIEKYVEITQVDTDAERAETENLLKSVETGHSFDEVKFTKSSNEKTVSDFLETNNYPDTQSKNNYEEIYIDSNFEDIHVSNYEEVQTVYNEEVETMNFLECDTVSNLDVTQNASNFNIKSVSNVKDIQPIGNLENKEIHSNLKKTCVNNNFQEAEIKNIYEDISTDSSSNDTQILRNLCKEPVKNSKEIRPARSIQTFGNMKGRAVDSDLEKEPFANYTSILEIFDNNFSSKQIPNQLKDSRDTNIVSQQRHSDILLAIPTVSNIILPSSTDTEDTQSGNIIFKNYTDDTFLGLPITSDIKLIPITNTDSNFQNQDLDTLLLTMPNDSDVGKINTLNHFKKTAKSTKSGKLTTTNYDEIQNVTSFQKIAPAGNSIIIKDNNNVKNVAVPNFNKQTPTNCETNLTLKHSNVKKRPLKKTASSFKKYDCPVTNYVPTSLNEESEAANGTYTFNGDKDVLEIQNLLEVKFFEGEVEHKNGTGNNSSLLKLKSADGSSIEITRMQSVPRNPPPLKNSVKKHNAGSVPKALPPLKRNPASLLIKNGLDSISDTNVRFLNEANEDNSFSNNTQYKNVTESQKGFKLTKDNSKKHSFANNNDIPINDFNSNVQLYINKICQCGRNSHGTGNDVEIQSLTITKINRPDQCKPKKTIECSSKSNQCRRKKVGNNNCTKVTTSKEENILGTDDPAQLQINLTKINNMTFCSEPTKSDSGEEYVTVFQIVSDDSTPEPQINLATDLLQHLSNISNTEIKSKDLEATERIKNNPDKMIPVTTDFEKTNISMKAKDLESMYKIIPSDNSPLEIKCKNSEASITKSQNLSSISAQKDIFAHVKISDLQANNKIIRDKTKPHENLQQLPIVFQEYTSTDAKKMEVKSRNYKPKSNFEKKINHYFKKCKNLNQQKSLWNQSLINKNMKSTCKSKTFDKNKRSKTKEDRVEIKINNILQTYKELNKDRVNTDSDVTTGQDVNNELNNNRTDNIGLKEDLHKTNNVIPTHETYKKPTIFKRDIVNKDVNEDFKKVKDTNSSDLPHSKPFRYCMICKSIFYTPKCNYCFGKKGQQLYKSILKQCGPDYLTKIGQSFTCGTCSYKATSKNSLDRHILSKCCRTKR